ncbi:MAG TPA: bifunctional homocysteine S-methyltransferase/methylenetetrahydrofolate reductase [Candidatus Acidoferrales bacterium]|jgi:homocysteine S-methyltransferase|nr:bifunctional homocysteine S-methyltransferase/methylenetetrahydrofolate reductase [Candidatus Acidoferrales bacterium]
MNITDFEQRIQHAVLVADGAMGSVLFEAVGPQRSFEELNVSRPEDVFRVHQSYIEAGAQIIETNTFGANRSKLAALGLADLVSRINHRGVKIAREAREASPHEVLIAGSIGPLAIAPEMREIPRDEMVDVYREQAQALEERGVDLFILETFSNIDMLMAAIDAVRSFSALPIVAELTFSSEGTTLGGVRPGDAASRLAHKNVQVIGVNCTLGPQSLLPVLEGFSGATRALSAMPNVGFPTRVGDRTVYPRSSPEYFALFAREAAALGARIVGGCCGTTPEHIRAMAQAVRGLKPAQTVRSAVSAEAVLEKPRAARRDPESGLWRKLKAGEFTVSVEIDPPKGISLERIFEQVDKITVSGCVDTIDINSGTLARVGMDALMLAGALQARGVETVPHVTTRDQNLIGLQAALLGAWSIGGVRNFLAITGDPPSVGDYPETSGVYEIDSIGLVKVASRLNQGNDWAGKALGGATNFTVGVAVNPTAEDLDYEIQRFFAKVEAGAHFAMTQPLFDPEQWHLFLQRIGGRSPIPVLAGIWPLTSYKQALRLNNEVPGILIPEPVLKEMESAGTTARDRGFALARRMLDWARTELAGAYLIPPFKRYEEILELFT